MRRPQSGWRQFPKRTDGISAVEFALLLPVMLLIVCGIMDFGNLYFQAHIANEAAREAARLGAITKQNQATVQATIRKRIRQCANSELQAQPPGHRGHR